MVGLLIGHRVVTWAKNALFALDRNQTTSSFSGFEKKNGPKPRTSATTRRETVLKKKGKNFPHEPLPDYTWVFSRF